MKMAGVRPSRVVVCQTEGAVFRDASRLDSGSKMTCFLRCIASPSHGVEKLKQRRANPGNIHMFTAGLFLPSPTLISEELVQ